MTESWGTLEDFILGSRLIPAMASGEAPVGLSLSHGTLASPNDKMPFFEALDAKTANPFISCVLYFHCTIAAPLGRKAGLLIPTISQLSCLE